MQLPLFNRGQTQGGDSNQPGAGSNTEGASGNQPDPQPWWQQETGTIQDQQTGPRLKDADKIETEKETEALAALRQMKQ
jgi:hypothetical protein